MEWRKFAGAKVLRRLRLALPEAYGRHTEAGKRGGME
jgi:hypothetical protein